jgi:hypothetical protein
VKRLLCLLFGCHWQLSWIRRMELSPGKMITKRWRLRCAWCNDWSLIPNDGVNLIRENSGSLEFTPETLTELALKRNPPE